MSEIKGMSELLAKLNALGDMKGQVMLDATVAGGLEINNEAKVKAPHKTGTLKRSIHIGSQTGKSAPDFTPNDVAGTYSDVGGQEVSNEKVSILIGTNLIYAAPQEFGTSTGVPAHPYLRPAVNSKTNECFRTIGDALKVMIDQRTK